MMKKILIFLFTSVFQNIYSQTLTYNSFINGGNVVNQKFSLKIPFKINPVRLIIVPVSIKDTLAYFIFDTAASTSVIDKGFYNKVKINIISKSYVKDANDIMNPLDVVEYDTCRIGNLDFTNVRFVVSDMTKVVQGVSGILGANIINKLNWYIDYDALQLTITDDELKFDDLVTKINVNYENNRPFTTLRIGNEIIGNCALDFGSNDGINVSKNVFNKLSPLRSSNIKTYGNASKGLHGDANLAVSSYFQIENQLKLDKFRIPYTRIYSDNDKIKVGQIFFSQYNIGIDSKNMHYHLYKRKNIAYDNLEYESFPFALSLKNNVMAVSHTHLCSIENIYNIHVGDELETVNGKSAGDFKNEDEFITWYHEESTLLVKFKKIKEAILIKKEKDCGN